MAEESVLTHVEEGIGTITLNRPERLNAISIDMLEVLIGKMEALLDNEQVRVLVLTGAGKAFCAGADQGEMVERDAQEWEYLVERYLDPIRLIASTTKPVIAAINGDTVGGGLGLAIACDFRIAVEKARFCAPFVAIGLAGCDMSAGYFLPRLVGLGKATEMMMTARFVKAEEAERIGLVQRIVPAGQLAEETSKLAKTLASYSPIAMGWTKKAIRRSLDRDMENEFDYEVLAQIQCLQTQEHRDALKAYQAMMMGKKHKSS
ncbi:MAG: enoyl-CoA hydratase/isomerase family protein [bacterium]